MKKIITYSVLIMLLFVLLASCGTAKEESIAGSSDATTMAEETEAALMDDAANELEKSSEEVTSETVDGDSSEAKEEIFYTKESVNFREGSSTQSKIIRKLDANTKVFVLGKEANWYKVRVGDDEGYIREDYLDRSSEEKNSAEAEDEKNSTYEAARKNNGANKLIVIDAGHQRYGDSTQEPIGPGATTTKARVTGGTRGKFTGITEFELNLDVTLRLKAELEQRGYLVILCRDNHDVNLSNSERAKIANDNNADAFLRIHANGSDNPQTSGMLTICQTANNPYNGELYEKSKALSTLILDEMVAATGANRERVWETDSMSGVNLSKVPVTIIEMGYMSNEKEDKLLATDEYKNKIVQGIANGVDLFFEKY